jgi:hypothetical protein
MAFGIKSGTWSITSEKDPRWNASGTEEYMSVFVLPKEAQQHLENCKAIYGEQPDDLEYFCMKD